MTNAAWDLQVVTWRLALAACDLVSFPLSIGMRCTASHVDSLPSVPAQSADRTNRKCRTCPLRCAPRLCQFRRAAAFDRWRASEIVPWLEPLPLGRLRHRAPVPAQESSALKVVRVLQLIFFVWLENRLTFLQIAKVERSVKHHRPAQNLKTNSLRSIRCAAMRHREFPG